MQLKLCLELCYVTVQLKLCLELARYHCTVKVLFGTS